MNKRELLKGSGALITGAMLSRIAPAEAHMETRTNWSGNYIYTAARLNTPRDVQELQHILRSRGESKALGSKHSFNSIADTVGDQISLEHFDQITMDEKSRTVTVGGGVRYGDLARKIDAGGFAVHNLASLPHVTVAGACATATHGSGVHNGNLSTGVAAIEMVTANGDLVTLSRQHDGPGFSGAVVALGALGVVTRTTLHVIPRFEMRQVVYENLPFDQLKTHLGEILSAGYSVSLFTDWQNHRATQVWIKSVVTPGESFRIDPSFFGATAATRKLHPLAGHSAENCTDQLGTPGPWYERLPHFRMNFTPSSGAELQSEFFVPRDRGFEAMLAVEQLRDRITPHLFISEIRTIAADDLWMSPCYGRDSMAIHFTWKPEWTAVKGLLPLIEEKLAPFDARPHWAKLFTMAPARLRSQYAKLPDFRALMARYDPQGRFHNPFLTRNLLA